MKTTSSPSGHPFLFIALVFLISIPLFIFGGSRLPLPIKLPVSALMVVAPTIAASILVFWEKGTPGLKELFSKVFDARKIRNKAWYLPVLLINPLIFFLSYLVMRLLGLPLPVPEMPWAWIPVFLLLFFIAGAGEELGWSGYAIDPLQARWGALKASLFLGLVWAAWHLIPDLQLGQAADWIIWQRLGTVARRVLTVWIYNNTGKSVFAAILFHDTDNVSSYVFPNFGSHYNPAVTTPIYIIAALVALIGWRPRTPATRRAVTA